MASAIRPARPHPRAYALALALSIAASPLAYALPRPAVAGKPQEPNTQAATPDAAAYNWDVSDTRPYLPALPNAIDDTQQQAMAKLAESYRLPTISPSGKGAAQDKIDDVTHLIREVFEIRRDPATGAVSGRPVQFTGESGTPAAGQPDQPLNFVGDIENAVRQLNGLYQTAAAGKQTDQLTILYRDVVEHLVNHGWDPQHEAQAQWIGNGYSWRNRQTVRHLLAMRKTLGPQLHDRWCETLAWLSSGQAFYNEDPRLSTDAHLNTVWQATGAILAMHDSPVKWQRVLCMRRAYDLAILGTEGSGKGLVTPDGGIIHHGGMHVSYAGYSFVAITNAHVRFANAGIIGPYSAQAAQRLVRAGRAWAWFTQPGQVVSNLEMRVPLPYAGRDDQRMRSLGGADIAWHAEQVVTALREAGVELAEADPLPGIILAKKPAMAPEPVAQAWAQAGIQPDKMTGHLSLPVSGAALHRRDGWLISLRGCNRFFRGGEGAAYAAWGNRITYAGRFCNGSLMIVNVGEDPNLLDSGYRADGFNYALVPGTTAPITPPQNTVGRYFGSDANLGGGVNMDGQGLWGFGPSSSKKSALFIDNRVTLVTTDAKSNDGYTLATTLCQTAHNNQPNEPMQIDGRALAEPGEWAIDQPAGHWFTDHLNRGYIIHDADGPLRLFRREQQWTYTDKHLLKNPDDAGRYNEIVQSRPIETMLAQFQPTRADYTTAYIDHGQQVARGHCAFTVLVNADAKTTADFAQAMATPQTAPLIYRSDELTHTYFDRTTGLWGYVFFDNNANRQPLSIPGNRNAVDLIRRVGRPCFILLKTGGATCRVAIASTDLSNQEPLMFTLKGRWSVAAETSAATTAEYDPAGDCTTLSTPYQNQTQVDLVLRRE